MKSLKKSICIFLCSFVLTLPPYLLISDEKTKTIDFDEELYRWSKPLAETIHLVHSKHVLEVNPEEPMKNCIRAFVKTLDPHSRFMDIKEYNELRNSIKGERCGAGILIDNTKDEDLEYLLVLDTVANGPADRAGIQAGDKIIAVDEQPLKGFTAEEVVEKIKGEKKTKVTLSIKREGVNNVLEFPLIRDIVKEPNAVCYYFNDHDMYYISFHTFTESSPKQLEDLLNKVQKQQAKGLILDLRNNTGGLLTSAIEIAELFLEPKSLIVTSKGRNDKILDQHFTTKKPISNHQTPIIILINNYSASAAEILPGCLVIYASKPNALNPHIYTMGMQTYGKGTVQEVMPLCKGAVKLTIAEYLLADGISIQGIGIKPDFHVEPRMPLSSEIKWLDKHFGREKLLKNSIKTATSTKEDASKDTTKKEKTWHEKKLELISTDYTILSAVRLLELLNITIKAFPEKTKTRAATYSLLTKLYNPDDRLTVSEITLK